jgi:hypothetical protein
MQYIFFLVSTFIKRLMMAQRAETCSLNKTDYISVVCVTDLSVHICKECHCWQSTTRSLGCRLHNRIESNRVGWNIHPFVCKHYNYTVVTQYQRRWVESRNAGVCLLIWASRNTFKTDRFTEVQISMLTEKSNTWSIIILNYIII